MSSSPTVPSFGRNVARFGLTLVLAFATLSVGLGATPASAATGDVTVQGVVYDADTITEVEGAQVQVFSVDPEANPGAVAVDSASTVGGQFELTVEASDAAATDFWLRATKAGLLPATQQISVQYDSGDPTFTADDFYLQVDTSTFGQLHGAVKDGSGAAVAEDEANIRVYRADDDSDWIASQYTDSDGNWQVFLAPGSYKIRVVDNFSDRPGVWVGGTSFASATSYAVTTDGETAVATAVLTAGPKVSGVVKDAGGQPIKGIDVTINVFVDEGDDSYWSSVRSARTDASGQYSLENVEPGTYRVQFVDPLADYVQEWYNDKASPELAQNVAVASSDSSLGTVVLAAAPADTSPALTGLVRDVNGAAIAGANVTLYAKDGSDWNYTDFTYTNRSGRYRFAGLDEGEYTVRVDDDGQDGGPRFESQYYNDKYQQADADTISTDASGAASASNVTVTRYGTISGALTAAIVNGEDNPNFNVNVYDEDGAYVASADVDSSGSQTIFAARGLLPGRYTVLANGWQNTSSRSYAMVPEWWKDSYSQTKATRLTVADGGAVTGIDIALDRKLVALSTSTVSGTAVPTKVLTASTGVWNRNSGNKYTYQWTRSGVSISGRTSSTYTATTSDLNKAIAVKVTAKDKYGDLVTGTSTSKSVTIKVASKLTLGATPGTGKATVSVTLSLPGTAASKVTGPVTIYDGSASKGSLKLVKGKISKSLTLSRGSHTIKATYAGNSKYAAVTASKTITVK